MEAKEPWVDYSRDRLPRGWSYPLGQEDFLVALRRQNVKVRTLSLSWLDTKPTEPLYLLTADWFSDARANYFGIEERDSKPLRIIHHAVPSQLRQEVRDALTDGHLQTMRWSGSEWRQFKETPGRQVITIGTSLALWTATSQWMRPNSPLDPRWLRSRLRYLDSERL